MAVDDVIPPQASLTVDHDHRPVLYLPDGRVLVRQAGFRAGATSESSSSGNHAGVSNGGGKKKAC